MHGLRNKVVCLRCWYKHVFDVLVSFACREKCKPADKSGGGKSHTNKRLDIEQDASEINVKVDILQE